MIYWACPTSSIVPLPIHFRNLPIVASQHVFSYLVPKCEPKSLSPLAATHFPIGNVQACKGYPSLSTEKRDEQSGISYRSMASPLHPFIREFPPLFPFPESLPSSIAPLPPSLALWSPFPGNNTETSLCLRSTKKPCWRMIDSARFDLLSFPTLSLFLGPSDNLSVIEQLVQIA